MKAQHSESFQQQCQVIFPRYGYVKFSGHGSLALPEGQSSSEDFVDRVLAENWTLMISGL